MLVKYINIKKIGQFLFPIISILGVLSPAVPAKAVPAEVRELVKCVKGNTSNSQSCNLRIYQAVLSGNSGYIVEVSFSDGTAVEAFCIDERSKQCLVRTNRDRKWESGRIDLINKNGFQSPFSIETSKGKTLAIYDAPSIP